MKVAEETIVGAAQWRSRIEEHLRRAKFHTASARERRDRGLPHPIQDFLFDYYPYPFSLLEQWHPGTGVTLQGDGHAWPVWFCSKHYSAVGGTMRLDLSTINQSAAQRFEWIRDLLVSTNGRAPNFGCHGLHEWAMVYRGCEVRHEKTLPMRVSQGEIDTLVESRPICCSHHDAFRFFAVDARPFNRLQPSLEARGDMEQPGCVHANMDLYKWAAKAMPWVGSDLLLDCFELAVELRDLDMRASPYDLRSWGREAIPVETEAGRRQYETEQRRLAQSARHLRDRLIATISQVA